MFIKYSIALLLAGATADKYKLKVDGPCADVPDFEKIMPLLIGSHLPLEKEGCFDEGRNHKYEFKQGNHATCEVEYEIHEPHV